MTSAADNQAYGSPNWSRGPNDPRGPWGHFYGGAMPPWFATHAVKPILIVGTILGFVFWWPIGLALLAVLIWNKRACGWGRFGGSWQGPGAGRNGTGNGPSSGGWQRWTGSGGGAPPTSGNRAFDDYRAATLKRLEEEQTEFGEFLDRLRFAKDKAEFDQFMTERRNNPETPQQPPTPSQA